MLIRSASGLRGIVKDDFSPEMIDQYVASFISNQNITSCVIGRDGRSSGKDIAQWVVNALTNYGVNVDNCDLATTPTMQLMTEKDKYDGGIVITASHNPSEYNGLKFLQKDGTFLSPNQCNELFASVDNKIHLDQSEETGTISKYDSANAEHIAKVIDATCIDSKSIASKKFKVVVDAVNGAGSTILPKLCEDLGCHVTTINCNGDGNFTRVAEPLAENLNNLEEKVLEVGADIGFATDPDGDRLSIVSNKGYAIGEEYTLALSFKNFINYQDSMIVTNLSTSRMIDDISSGSIRTKIGEAHVVEKMKELNILIGGEGNGGVILKEVHLGRDSLVAIAMILNLLSRDNKSLNEIISEIPSYIFIKDKINIDNSIDFDSLATLFDCDEINTEDGIKFTWPEKWIHIRKSNTEPIIRIFAEAKTENEVDDLIQTLKDYLK
ncbi:MAG TPA: phosphoglucosamine mutase [Candidatus Marinimicrobia bacterium]|nr:phosphoglucosamine mutase [Candidatus Neomarinimicrobiota bacterium]